MKSSVCAVLTFLTLAFTLAIPSQATPPAYFWGVHFGGTQNDNVNSVAVIPGSGDIIAAGYFNGTVNFGSGNLVAASDYASDGWVARFNNRGELKWVKTFGSTDIDDGVGVAVDPSGNIYLAGTFQLTINLGGSDLISNGTTDFFVAKFDPAGAHLWSHGFGGGGQDYVNSMAMDGSGNVLVTGNFDGTTNLGGADIPSVGNEDAFIVKYSTGGVWQWNVAAGGVPDDAGYGIAADGPGNVYASGFFSDTIAFGGNPTLTTAGGFDVYLVKYSSGGAIQWSQRRGGTGEDYTRSLMADPSGNVVVTGGFTGTSNFGGSSLISAGENDIFLARYNTSGVHQWSYRFGGTDVDLGIGMTLLASGNVLLSGYCSAGTNFGGGVLTNAGATDVCFAKFTSSGTYVWSKAVGGPDDDRASAIGADVAGNPVVGGQVGSVANLGGGNLVSSGQTESFIAKYGTAEPAITAIKDVGNDQGRSVRITAARSAIDDGTAALPISEYQAFRRVLPLPASAALKGHGVLAVPSGQWEFVASVPASNAGTYRIIAPTLADSTIVSGMYRTKFFVRAATTNPSVFFDSPVDSGYSLDNLAPGIPSNFVYASGTLTWDESSAADFDYFSIYGSNTGSFASATLLDYSVAPALDVSSTARAYYFVTATDFSGNEGKPAVVHTASGVGETPKNYVLSVSAYPNPFNPGTTVRYTLPARGHVTLAIYDLRGERVATLADRDDDAGAYMVTWTGKNDRGDGVGSGVYFARLKAGAGERSYKLVLLK